MIWLVPIILICYLLGSMPLGYWLVKAVKRVDVRQHGSGNIGMTNVWRTVGAGWGIATLVLDIAKGAFSVWLGGHFFPDTDWAAILCGLAVLLGNVFSIFLGFKGGKGIGVSVGVFFSLLPLESALGTLVFALAVGLTRMISVGSISGVATMAILALFWRHASWATLFALFAVVMVLWTHRTNVKKIMDGTENKIGKKK